MMNSFRLRSAFSSTFALLTTSAAAVVLCLCVSMQSFGQVSSYHYDNLRTGTTLSETILTTSNVNVADFGKLFSLPVDGKVFSQPLYLPNVTIPQKGIHNVLYLATSHNSVYAFDADSSGSPLWQISLGASILTSPAPLASCCTQQDLLPEIGITSTPVIDAVSGTIYVVAESLEKNAAIFRLHALDVATGLEKLAPVVIQGSVSGNSFDSSNGYLTFTPRQQQQRPGLLLANNNIYVAFGANQENTPFHGWLFSYNAATLARTGILCFSPDEQQNGVSQGRAAPAADASGNVYLQTGKGRFDVDSGGRDLGDSLVRVTASKSGLTVRDYFTPSTQMIDDLSSWDLGSSSPLLIPGTSLGVAAGKAGKIYVFDSGNLGHFHTTDHVVQEWQAASPYSGRQGGGFWGGSYVFYNSTLFTFAEGESLKAFSFKGSQFNTVPTSQSAFAVPVDSSNGPALSVSANGVTLGTGIVWASLSANGPSDHASHPGVVYAFDAADVSRVLWTSNDNPSRDAVGHQIEGNPPVVANGKMYLSTSDNSVNVYGLLSSGQSERSASHTDTAKASGSAVAPRAHLAAAAVPAGGVTLVQQASGANVGNGQNTLTVTLAAQPASGNVLILFFGQVGASETITSISGATWTRVAENATGNIGDSEVWLGTNPVSSAITITGNTSFGSFQPGYAMVSEFSGVSTTPDGSPLNTTGGWPITTGSLSTSSAGDLVLTSALSYNGGGAQATVTSPWTLFSPTAGTYSLAAGYEVASTTGTYAATWNGNGSPQVATIILGLKAAAGSTGSISATAGTPQSVTINTAFATALQATVKDAANNPVSGATVKFTAPSTGASASFSGSATATAVTNSAGVATAPALKANGQAGSYTITATASGVGNSASFSLNNLAGTPSSITPAAGTPQSATVNAVFATPLQAIVKDAASNALSGVTVTFTAPTTGASASFSGSATATAVTNASGIATAPALTANGQAGSYSVKAAASGLSVTAGFSLTNTAVASGGGSPALTGSGTSAAGTINLTTEGSSDWVHWGDSSLTRKAGVSAQISNYAIVGVNSVSFYSNDPRALSWTDGTPTTSGSNNNGIYINSQQNGFSFTAPADTGTRVLTVHVGGWMSGATLTAHLSDKSASDYVDVTSVASGQFDRNYTLTYSAASAGQTLTVSWVNTSTAGNVTLNGAALAGGSPASGTTTISATAGTPQSATINTVFGTALQATVKDASNNPMSGVTVTFTSPSSGAGASFNGSATATAVTNASGIATAPPLKANAQTGSYTVTAAASGVSKSAGFSLNNLAGTPAAITATAGTPQSATVNTAFAAALQATVKDSAGNLLTGVTVTFTAPSSGASASFNGAATATAVTNASGIATAPALTAGSAAGSYTITATAGGVGPAGFSLTNTAVVSGGGNPPSGITLVQQASGANVGNGQNTLTVTLGAQPASADVLVLFFGQVGASETITSISGATWTRVAQNSTGNIGDSEVWVGTNPVSTTITITGNTSFGSFQPGYAIVSEFSGINTTVDGSPLNTVGGWPVKTGSLSTSSAGDLLLTSALSYNGGGTQATVTSPWTLFSTTAGTYSLAASYQVASTTGAYAATWNGSGSPQVATVILALKAAAGTTGGISATAGTPQSATINTAFATALQVTVKNASNNPLSGVTVKFTAPSSGASASFSGSATATAVTNGSGIATAPALKANGQAGAYTVTATASGVSNSASFSLNNLGGTPSSITATAGTPQTTTVNTIFATPLQATVKDSNNNVLSGVAVTFTAPSSSASASFSGSATATAVTNSSGIAAAPALTANGQAGSYSVKAAASGVATSAAFSLTNSTAPAVPIKLIQQAQIDSMINIQSESLSFTSPNTAGNWIGVAIFGGQSNTHLFTVTDSNGNNYNRALTVGNTHDNITLGMYYAENIRSGNNKITVVPDTSGYIRVVIVEYSGLATVNSLDVTAAAQGGSVSPNSGTATTTANGDLLWGASASADAEPFAGPGYTLDELVPASPGTALTTEDQIQTTAGPASASLTFGSAKDWTMGLVALRKAP